MDKNDTHFPFEMYSCTSADSLVNFRKHDDTMEIVEITGGRVRMQIGTEITEAEKGDFVYIPRNMIFKADAIESEASIRGMIFDYSILADNLENFDTEIIYMFFIQSTNRITVFKKEHAVYPILSKYMQESYDEYVLKDVCYKLPIRANIYLMMTALLRYYCGSKDESDRIVYHNVMRLRPVLAFIDKHFCEKIYVDYLADMITVSPDYFTKMFRDSIGKTPIEYINGLRINKAISLLVEGKATITEISETTGFCNPNYFHKIFKKYMKISPMAYKKNI